MTEEGIDTSKGVYILQSLIRSGKIVDSQYTCRH